MFTLRLKVLFKAALLKIVSNHPNIIEWYRTLSDGENFYILMEYAHGGELFDRIGIYNYFKINII